MNRETSLRAFRRWAPKSDDITQVVTATAAEAGAKKNVQDQGASSIGAVHERNKTTRPEQFRVSTASESNVEVDHTLYPQGLQFALITVSLCLCVFVVGLDTTILATAIPSITDEFHSLQDVGWYGAAFRLTSSMVQLSQGKLFDNYPTKWMFLGNMILFEIGVAVSGTAASSPIFIVGRAIAGVGFSGISQGCMVIIAMSTPLNKRATYLGLVSASEFLAIAIAPLLGGVLTSALSWRWCFYINMPIAAPPAILLLLLKLPNMPSTNGARSNWQKLGELDLLGSLFLAPAVFCLLLALQWGGGTYMWDNARVIVLLILAPILFAVFFYIQDRKQDAGMLPPRILRKRQIIMASLNGLSMAATRAIVQYYLAIWFQAVLGVTPLQSGINMLPLVVAILISAVAAGFLISWCGSYMAVMIPASLFVLVGVAVMTSLTPASHNIRWIAPLVLLGVGSGSGLSPPFLAAQTVLQADDISKGMALMTFSQDVGEAIFVSIAQAVFLNRVEHDLKQNVPGLSPAAIIDLGATDLASKVPADKLTGVIGAYSSAVTTTFYLATGLAGLVVISACLMRANAITVQSRRQGG